MEIGEYVALIFTNGIGIILYIVLMIIMPKAQSVEQSPKETIQEKEIGGQVKEAGEGSGSAFAKDDEGKHLHRSGWAWYYPDHRNRIPCMERISSAGKNGKEPVGDY